MIAIAVIIKSLVLSMALAVYVGDVQENSKSDAKAVQFFREILRAYQDGSATRVKQLCQPREVDVKVMCNLISYLKEGHGAEKRFVAGSPQTASEVRWLMRWDRLLFQLEEEKSVKLFPAGFAARYMDEIAGSVKATPANALDKLFWIYRNSDGFYAEHARGNIEAVLRANPRLLYEQWSTIRNHKNALIGIAYGLNFDSPEEAKRLATEACGPDTTGKICQEIRETFSPKEK